MSDAPHKQAALRKKKARKEKKEKKEKTEKNELRSECKAAV